MTQPIISPQWNADFEERLFIEVARRHVPGFPEKLTEPPREPRTRDELEAVRDYYTRMASHDLFIVHGVAHALDTLIADDLHFHLILSRQLGHARPHAPLP